MLAVLGMGHIPRMQYGVLSGSMLLTNCHFNNWEAGSAEPCPQRVLSSQAFGALGYATQYALTPKTLLNIICNAHIWLLKS